MLNLGLPKTGIGEAFYSSQSDIYVFGSAGHHRCCSVPPEEDIYLFIWQENKNRKDVCMYRMYKLYFPTDDKIVAVSLNN